MLASAIRSFVLGLILVVPVAAVGEQASIPKCRFLTNGRFSGGLDPSVAEVTTGGFWASGSGSGTYRIVVFRYGGEHTNTATFVQWLAADPQTGEEQEIATAPVGQLNDIVLGVVSGVRFIRTDAREPAVSEVIVVNRYSFNEKKLWLILRGPGDVTVAESYNGVHEAVADIGLHPGRHTVNGLWGKNGVTVFQGAIRYGSEVHGISGASILQNVRLVVLHEIGHKFTFGHPDADIFAKAQYEAIYGTR